MAADIFTGWVKHRERSQTIEERPVPPRSLVPPLRAGGGLLAGVRSLQLGGGLGLLHSPFCKLRADHHRLDKQHDLVAVSVVRF